MMTMYSKIMQYALKKEDLIDIVTTCMKCPHMLATAPAVRKSSYEMVVHAVSANYPDDQRLLALVEEFDMFMDSLVTYPAYKA